MSQYPHDEFDDVSPYQQGAVGKHRAPGGSTAAATGSGGLKWIAFLAVAVLIVGGLAYFLYPRIMGDDTDPVADGEQEQEEPDGGEDDSSEDNEEDSEDGQEEDDDSNGEPSNASDSETFIQVANYQGMEGGATEMSSQLDELDYNVVWSGNWNFEEVEPTPAVFYPTGASEAEVAIAEELASNFNIDSVNEHPQISYVTYVVGEEFEG